MQDKAAPWQRFSKASRTDKPNVGRGRSRRLPVERASGRIARAPPPTPNSKLWQARPEIDQAFLLLHSSILTTSARSSAR
jgi:hypothetical protein